MRNKLIILMVFIVGFLSCYSQERKPVQLSGIITTVMEEPIQFVHVIQNKNGSGTYSDDRGMYSIIVHPGDTIFYSCVGFKTEGIVIPGGLESSHYFADIYLLEDTVKIDEVIILPWDTYEEFKYAVAHLDIHDKDAENARKNIALIKTHMIYYNTPSPKANFRQVMQEQHEKSMTKGQYPSIPILNPLNWAEFIQAIKEGKFKYDRDEHSPAD